MSGLKNLKCLLPDTEAVLLKMLEECTFLEKYVLVGGSALSMHLCHRKSEDLDFFTYEDSFDKIEIFNYINTFERKDVLHQTEEQVDVLLNGVKVTFFNAKWSFLKPHSIQQFNLASVESIAAMKVNMLFLRAKYRDYYDLYFLVKKSMSIRKVFECGLDILEGINYKLFTVAILYTDDIEDDHIEYLDPVEKLTKDEIRQYLEYQISKRIKGSSLYY